MNFPTRCVTLLLSLTLTAGAPGLIGQATQPPRTSHPSAPSPVSKAAAPTAQSSLLQPLRQGYEFPRNTLRYAAEYHFVTGGLATFRIERQGNQEHIYGTADSTGVVAMLYRVQDRFNSYFDPQTLCSSKLVKHTEEGSHARDTVITYDYKRGKAVLEEKNLKTGQSKRVENDIPNCVTDVMSGIFYLSSLPLDQGATYTIPLNDGGKTATIRAHVEGKEQIKTPAGTFQAIRVGPEGDYPALKNRGRILMWYSDDARHLPVQVQARMFFGTLTVTLQSIDK